MCGPSSTSASASAAPRRAPQLPPTRCLTWCVWSDPCGLACALLAVGTVLLVDYVTVALVVGPWLGLRSALGALHAGGFQVVIALILSSYARCMTTDPGSVPVGSATEADRAVPEDDPQRLYKPKRRFCERCRCIKPPRAHHCSTCGRCVNKMDHHCPWVNNCVGSNNFKFFLLFLLWTFSGALYGACMAVMRLLACYGAFAQRGLEAAAASQQRGGGGRGAAGSAAAASAANSFGRRIVAFLAARAGRDTCAVPDSLGLVLVIVSTVMAIFFVIFTACMAYDQYQVMTTDVTGIEYIKKWREAPRSLWAGLEEACGEPFSWRWLVPLAQPHPSPALYMWSETDDKDAYDVRDPAFQRHVRVIERALNIARGAGGDGKGAAASGGGDGGAQPERSAAADDDDDDDLDDGGEGEEEGEGAPEGEGGEGSDDGAEAAAAEAAKAAAAEASAAAAAAAAAAALAAKGKPAAAKGGAAASAGGGGLRQRGKASSRS